MDIQMVQKYLQHLANNCDIVLTKEVLPLLHPLGDISLVHQS